MPRKGFPPELRQQALEVYLEAGAKAASDSTGVPAGTIRSWAHRDGVAVRVRAQRQAAATDASAATAAEQRAGLATRCYSDALKLLEQLWEPGELVKIVTLRSGEETLAETVRAELDQPTPGDKRHLAVAAAVLIDKAQLLSGEATSRTGGMDWERELEAFTIGAAAGHHQPKVLEGLAEPRS